MKIAIAGAGAVSPAGWGADALLDSVLKNREIPVEIRTRGESAHFPTRVRTVPKPEKRFPWARHPRLRRSSPVCKYCAAASREALGEPRIEKIQDGSLKVGIIFCFMNGCVNFTSRFYKEVLEEPRTASPILFPETVFNAPSSHIASMLGTTEINYSLVGDSAQFVSGMDLAAQWIVDGEVDGCLVVGGEELDWLSSEALMLFEKNSIVSEGAGAIYLERVDGEAPVILEQITDPVMISNQCTQSDAARQMREALGNPTGKAVLCDGQTGSTGHFSEWLAWSDWEESQLSPKTILGEGMGSSVAWQCVLAAKLLEAKHYDQAYISAVGGNQQAIGAYFSQN